MAKPVKLVVSPGQIFGYLTVLDPDARYKKGQRAVKCRCVCGAEPIVLIYNLFRGNSRSCGCVRAESFHHRTHGMSSHPLCTTWRMMMERCEKPSSPAYANYGGRGIQVCERWRDVRLFIEDIGQHLGPRPKGKSLDRIDVNGNYEPGNVRWATQQEQNLNRRSLSLLQVQLLIASGNDWPADIRRW